MTTYATLLEALRKKHHEKLDHATNNPFVRELCDGTLDDAILFTYLTQDLKFFNLSLRLLARCTSLCTEPTALVTLGKQIGYLSASEATYFDLTLTELRSKPEKLAPAMLKNPSVTLPEVQEFLNFLDESMNSDSYTEIITCLFIFEFIYLEWAQRHGSNATEIAKLPYKHKEWVYLHIGPDFERWVNFLGAEVARVTEDFSEREKAERIAVRVLDLECKFFDSCYYYKS